MPPPRAPIMPFMPRIMPFMPPPASLPIIFSICWYCLSSRLTSAGVVPEPRAMRARREPLSSAGIAAFLLGHRADDRDHARHFLAGDLLSSPLSGT